MVNEWLYFTSGLLIAQNQCSSLNYLLMVLSVVFSWKLYRKKSWENLALKYKVGILLRKHFGFHNLLSGNRDKFNFREVGVSEDQPPADHNKGSWRQSINTQHSNVHNQNPCRFPIKEVGCTNLTAKRDWRETNISMVFQHPACHNVFVFLCQ